jgi:hypothetical protein
VQGSLWVLSDLNPLVEPITLLYVRRSHKKPHRKIPAFPRIRQNKKVLLSVIFTPKRLRSRWDRGRVFGLGSGGVADARPPANGCEPVGFGVFGSGSGGVADT